MRRISRLAFPVIVLTLVTIGAWTQTAKTAYTAPEYCWGNDDCSDKDYCLFHDCDAETGYCVERPVLCVTTWKSVCGCDGNTYSNSCFAALRGMSVDHEGKCKPQHCWSNANCGPDEYCFFGDCSAETGYCTQRPLGCPDVWSPVCGCDSDTYVNSCFAALHGVSVDHVGVCDSDHCFGNEDCREREYCYFYVCSVETGACVDRPEDCPDYFDPVCSCFGNDFDNKCWAAKAGESIEHYGPCDSSTDADSF